MSFGSRPSTDSLISDDHLADSILRNSDVPNVTTSSPQPEVLVDEWRRHVAADVAIGALLSLFVVFAVAGNVLVIVAILTDRTLRQTGNYFLVSLAVADTLVGVAVMTFAAANDVLGRWPFGAIVCDLWLSADVMCSTASILNLCAVSLDRYVHIRSPLHYSRLVTHRRVLAVIGLVWILSALISFLPIQLGWHRPQSAASGPLEVPATSSSWTSARPHPARDHVMSNLTSVPTTTFEPSWSMSDTSVATVGHTKLDFSSRAIASEECILELSPLYAVVSSMVSFFLPCVAMMFFYVNLHRYARQHAESIRKSNYFSSSPSTSTATKTLVSSPALLSLAKPTAPSTFQPTSTSSSPTTGRRHRARAGSTGGGGGGSSGALMSAAYRSASEHKAAITLGIIMGVFLFCWVPFFTINLVAAFCHGGECIPKIVFGVFTWLGYLNSTMNPIIYSVFNRQFRDAFKRVLNIRFRRDIDRRSSSEAGNRFRDGSDRGRLLASVVNSCNCCRTRIDEDANETRHRNRGHLNGSTPRRLRCDGRDAVAPSMSYDHVTASTYAHTPSLFSSSCRDFAAGSCGGTESGATSHANLQTMTITTDL